MAKRYSRRRTVRGKPNLSWITTCGLVDLRNGASGAPYDDILIPSDWQVGNTSQPAQVTLLHTVFGFYAFGYNGQGAANYSWCSNYAIVRTSDQVHVGNFPLLGKLSEFIQFFDEYDECLHWGQFMCQQYDVALLHGVYAPGGTSAAQPENMLNLNSRRILKGDDAIKCFWGAPDATDLNTFHCHWYARSLVRSGLK